jgi:hypothetical protein
MRDAPSVKLPLPRAVRASGEIALQLFYQAPLFNHQALKFYDATSFAPLPDGNSV